MQPEPWCWEASARAEAVLLSAPPSGGEVPLVPVHTAGGWDAALLALPPSARRWAEESGAKVAKSGDTFAVPSDEGRIAGVIVGLDSPTDVWGWAAAAGKLPGGGSKDGSGGEGGGAVYALDTAALEAFARGGVADAADAAALGWMLGSYKFDRYKTAKQGGKERGAAGARLVCPEAADRRRAVALARAHYFARDLINTPANDLGPEHLAREAVALAAAHEGAECSVVSGEGLLEAGYPAIHTVGRASTRPPALIDITWRPPGAGAASLPAVALVGKGVCFDTGGLNLKTAAGMKTMKKDMGGAALVLAVAHAVMSLRLPLALRVLVPAVENSVAGDAYRPLDVLDTRAGMTIEQGNCDAEGRLILADALFEAATARPDLIIDAATLTGAARAALGPELPAVFSSDDAAWRELERAAAEQNDPLWRLPLHRGYRRLLDSKVADIGSVASDGAGQGGAIVAALFLWEFVAAGARASAAPGAGGSGGAAAGPSDAAAPPPPWLHIDTGAWVGGARPGRPDGGEALGLLALVAMLRARYGGGGAARSDGQAWKRPAPARRQADSGSAATRGSGSSSSSTPSEGPQALYDSGIAAGTYRPDPLQAVTVGKLQALFEELRASYRRPTRPSGLTLVDSVAVKQSKQSWLHGLSTLLQSSSGLAPQPGLAAPCARGLYMFGGVGCGKTMLMDMFVKAAPREFQVQRTHFHDFMLDVHSRLRHAAGEADPLRRVADGIGAGTKVLALDELFVTDVADAMILHRLFGRLWDSGLVLVATSNRAPDRLYEGGLQRALFLPFIARLKEACVIHDMASPVDYRRLAHHARGLYFVEPNRDEELWEAFLEAGGGGGAPAPATLQVAMGRVLHVPDALGRAALFEFEELCGAAVAAADYISLASSFHTVALGGVPVFGPHNRSAAYRFVTLIDVLYEHRVKLMCSADAMPFELFERVYTHEGWLKQKDAAAHPAAAAAPAPAGPAPPAGGARRGAHSAPAAGDGDAGDALVDDNLGFSKDRTVSRLTEMQSLEYLAAHAEAHEPSLTLALREALDAKAAAARRGAGAGAGRAAAAAAVGQR